VLARLPVPVRQREMHVHNPWKGRHKMTRKSLLNRLHRWAHDDGLYALFRVPMNLASRQCGGETMQPAVVSHLELPASLSEAAKIPHHRANCSCDID
jgi:hypothetical protein